MYDWVPGSHLPRGGITPGQSALLGDLHGRIHAALRPFRDPRLPDRGTGSGWDREASLDTLGRVDDLIRYYPAQDAAQLELQSGLRRQMEMLESGVARPAADFAGLYRQCCHGDFHERNVIVGDGGEVFAVVDWELAGLLPPSFELLRALTFMALLEPPLASPYFDAYRRHAEVRDWEASVEMWWQSQLHSVWVYEARYIEGNRAVEPFLAEHVRLLARLGDPDYRASLVSLPRRT
jgi:Ser/Thr protein kinase RdoA (MazF antagonist)